MSRWEEMSYNKYKSLSQFDRYKFETQTKTYGYEPIWQGEDCYDDEYDEKYMTSDIYFDFV